MKKKTPIGKAKVTGQKEITSERVHMTAENDTIETDSVNEQTSMLQTLLISEPYVEVLSLQGSAKPPPVPLWPRSPLHYVFDHDPVLTTITCTLKLNEPKESTEHDNDECRDSGAKSTTPKSHKTRAATKTRRL